MKKSLSVKNKNPKRNKRTNSELKIDFDNLADLLKRKKSETEAIEKSELEMRIQRLQNLEASRSQSRWARASWADAPSLERRNMGSDNWIVDEPPEKEEKRKETLEDSDPFKYSTEKPSETEGPKYIPQPNQASMIARRIDITEGRSQFQNNNTALMRGASEFNQGNSLSSSRTIESYAVPKNRDISQEGRHDPFKKQEVKYEFKESGA